MGLGKRVLDQCFDEAQTLTEHLAPEGVGTVGAPVQTHLHDIGKALFSQYYYRNCVSPFRAQDWAATINLIPSGGQNKTYMVESLIKP